MKTRRTFALSFAMLGLAGSIHAQTITQIPDQNFTGYQINNQKIVVGTYFPVSGTPSQRVWNSGTSSFQFFSAPSGYTNPNGYSISNQPTPTFAGQMTTIPAWFDWHPTSSTYRGATAGATSTNVNQFMRISGSGDYACGNSTTSRGWVFTRPIQSDNSHRASVPYYVSNDTGGGVTEVNNSGNVVAASFGSPTVLGTKYYFALRGSTAPFYTSKTLIPSSASGFGNTNGIYGINDTNEVLVRSTGVGQEWMMRWSPTGGFSSVVHPSAVMVYPRDINNVGDVCGTYRDITTGATIAFVSRKATGTFIDLTNLIAGFVVTDAVSVNDNNDVLVIAQNLSNTSQYFTYVIDYP